MTLECRRSWEAEAVRDGRLVQRERDSFEEHAQRCVACSRELRNLSALAEALRASMPVSDEVTLRRLRQSTLQRADAALLTRRGLRWSIWQVAGALLAAVALGAALTWGRSSSWQVRTPPLVQVTGQGAGAVWTRSSSVHDEAIHLGEGVFRLMIQRKPDDARVIVYVPEGHIEDIGTVFEVSVQGGHTIRISVERGSVLFHRTGLPTLRLDAGAVWQPEPKSASASLPPSAATSLEPARPAAEPTRAHRGGHARAATPAAPEQAMPEEDLVYLRVLALLRDGRKGEAHLLAEDYVRRFPNGFRRPEIEHIAALAAP
ncbi:MAG TPA: hypothetical protein VJU61_03975 [Polyangiaceae bacterium]|nr:hypothetical protein [Polyangiaceae bacterium]